MYHPPVKHKKSHWLYPEASLLKEGVTIIEKWRAGLVWGRERGESGRERQRGGQAEKQSQFYLHSNILWALAPKSAPLSRTLFLDRTTIFPDQKIETIIVSSLQVRFPYNIKRLLPWVKLSFPNTPPHHHSNSPLSTGVSLSLSIPTHTAILWCGISL